MNLSDLPLELIAKVVEKTDLSSRLALRKVSRPLRSLVNTWKPMFKHVGILINSKCIKVDLEGVSINYTNMKYDKCLVGKPGQKPKKVDGDNMNVMFDDLLTFMSHPAFYLEHLSLTFTDDVSYEKFEKLRPKRMPFKITVYSFFFKANAFQSMNHGLDMLDMDKLRKVESDWMEQEDYFLRHFTGSWLLTDGNFVGEKSFVRIPRSHTKNQKERKMRNQESGQPGNYIKNLS